jgi:RimJ/RimL family protein N-acetyltransferase
MLLREAKFEDWEILLEWRNDSISRMNSFDQNIIDEKTHKDWLSRSLRFSARKIYILEDPINGSLGTIRCDTSSDNTNTLSWNINPKERGKGYGTLILKMFLENTSGEFLAEIKDSNIASIKLAEKNGFTKHSNQLYYLKS